MTKPQFKKILIAGGNGFLGKQVVKKMEISNVDYVSLSLRDGYDFRDFQQTHELFNEEKFDAIINCAAFVGGIQFGYEVPADIFLNNTLISTNLFECARIIEVKKFINPISNCSYPSKLTQAFSENEWWDGPLDESVLSYGFARKASWVHSWALFRQYGLDTTNLILPNMYGPGDIFDEKMSHALGALIMKFVDAKKKKVDSVCVWGSGSPVREWLYVEDGAEAIYRALSLKKYIEPINVGVGKGISISDLASLIKHITNYEGSITFDTSKPDGAKYKTMNNERLINLLNWTPPTKLYEGIQKTVDWFIQTQ